MTIKQFSILCECNPQTLRYYDSVGLLKPVKVDKWSGYRYYKEEQAVTFVKIKNLQKAGFTIEEIKELLNKDDTAVCRAFDIKIKEQEQKLNEIKKIRQSYQTAMEEIQEKVKEAKKVILKSLKEYDPKKEFGIGREEYASIINSANKFFDETVLKNPSNFKFDLKRSKEEFDYPKMSANRDFELVYEKHGWDFAKEFIDECPAFKYNGEYVINAHITQEKAENDMAFANVLVKVFLMKNPEKHKNLSCTVSISEDGKNHFWLFKRKED